MSLDLGLFRPPQEIRELNLLQELEQNPICSQRELSNKFGIALGVTNACLNGMAKKGWIQKRNLDHNKNGYFLTSKGLAEKIRILSRFISWRVQQYGALKDMIGRTLAVMEGRGIERVVFYGVGEEMEVALVALQKTNLRLVGIVEDDDTCVPRTVLGYELGPVSRIQELKPDAVLITSFRDIGRRQARLEPLIDSNLVHIRTLTV